ncbi:hypothetical protein P7K49_038647 [Saguinus oedipus]|uniref:Uncharacterized protein n=1 Tax=Saguinus oedipus TaxID=9490 RepID=A0ABQ9TFA8_SAGOE|nr:hypothetical protein P7K49_038647 [Saguinus oedipus]
MRITEELSEAPEQGLHASEEVIPGLPGALGVPAAGAPVGVSWARRRGGGHRASETRRPWVSPLPRTFSPAALAGPGSRNSGKRCASTGIRRSERCVPGREDSDVAAAVAAAAEKTRSPRVLSRRPPPSDPEEEEEEEGEEEEREEEEEDEEEDEEEEDEEEDEE